MKSVAVLMSVYNGQRYIDQQIQSILGQSYHRITLYIRDDGSEDQTMTIVKRIIDTNTTSKRIVVIDDDKGNVGFAESFRVLANAANHHNYYAFCDQDDYWAEEKIERAVNRLEAFDVDTPSVYMSNFWICDEQLRKKSLYKEFFDLNRYSLSRCFFEGGLTGFACVFNDAFKKTAFSRTKEFALSSHDKWISAVAIGVKSEFVFDRTPTAYYRRHDDAASSFMQSRLAAARWKTNHVLKGDYLEKLRIMIAEYKRLFYNNVCEEERLFLDIFAGKDHRSRFKKFFYEGRLRGALVDEIGLRWLLLMGI